MINEKSFILNNLHSIAKTGLTNTQKNWINNAIKLALAHNSGGRVRMVALAIKGNRIMGVGYNYYPHVKAGQGLYKMQGVHAELDLIEKFNISNSTIYLVGLSLSGNLLISKPCMKCNFILGNSSAKQIIYYSTSYTWQLHKIKELLQS